MNSRPDSDLPENGVGVGRSAKLMVPALVLAVLSFSLMQTLLVPALPSFMTVFSVDAPAASWILTSFLVCGAVAAPILGAMGDKHGHRKILIVALALFAAGSVLAAASGSFALLLVGRVLQGASTATYPLALAIVRRHAPATAQGSAFGLLSGTVGLGAGIALVVGGVILEAASWQWLFILGAVLALASLLLVALFVPASSRGKVERTDWAGVILLIVGLVPLLLGISQGASWGWLSLPILGLFVLAAVSLTALVVVELRIAHPLIDMRTLARPALAVTNGLSFFLGFIPYLFYIGLPVLFQASRASGIGHDLTVTQTGLTLAPAAVLVFLGGRVAPVIIKRFGSRVTAAVAFAFMAVGSVGIAVAPNSIVLIMIFFAFFGFGNGIGFTVCADLVARLAPREEIAAAMGVNGVVRTIGSALGAPIATVVLTTVAISAAGASSLASFAALFVMAAVAAGVGILLTLPLRIPAAR